MNTYVVKLICYSMFKITNLLANITMILNLKPLFKISTWHEFKNDAPLNSLMDSTMSPKVIIVGGIGVHSMVHNILRVEVHIGVSGWD